MTGTWSCPHLPDSSAWQRSPQVEAACGDLANQQLALMPELRETGASTRSPPETPAPHLSHKPTTALPLDRCPAMNPSPLSLPQLSSPRSTPKQGPEGGAEAGQRRLWKADGTSGHPGPSSSRYVSPKVLVACPQKDGKPHNPLHTGDTLSQKSTINREAGKRQ